MGEYDKKIEGQCGTCAHALAFDYATSPSGPEDGVHCNSEGLAKQLDEQCNPSPDDKEMADLIDQNQKELKAYGFMDLYRLECVAEETHRCDFWQPNDVWLANKIPPQLSGH
jgi:hypothetical protein